VKQIPTQALFTGQKVIWLPECQSTNSYALELVRKGETTEGLLIGTDLQTAGRGQRGNTWESAPGQNITVSIVLKPSFLPINHQFALSMAMANAVRTFLSRFTNHQVLTKWPNDTYIHNRKISGLLLESSIQQNRLGAMVVGIGINLNQIDNLPPQATSLSMLTGKRFDMGIMLGGLCLAVEQEYLLLKQTNGSSIVRQRYIESLMGYGILRNYRITLTGEHISAALVDIMPTGKAIFKETDGKTRSFDIKEIEWLW